MKKIVVTSTVIILMTIFAGTVLAKTGTVNTQNLKFRDGASTVDTNILKKLDKGTTLNIIEEVDGGWYKATYENKIGFVKKEYIDINNDDTGTTTGETGITSNPGNEPESDDDCKIISDTDIYVLPLINSTKISKIKANTKITIISENGKWKYIQSEDKLGWVIASKVKGGKTQQTGSNIDNNTIPQENITPQNDIVPETNTTSSGNISDNNSNNNSNIKFPATMYVNVDAVNIRKSATTSSDRVASVGLNTPVTVLGEEGDWYKVSVSDGNGYMKKEYLSSSKK